MIFYYWRAIRNYGKYCITRYRYVSYYPTPCEKNLESNDCVWFVPGTLTPENFD